MRWLQEPGGAGEMLAGGEVSAGQDLSPAPPFAAQREPAAGSGLAALPAAGCSEPLKMCQRTDFDTCGSGVAKQVCTEPGD